MDHDTLSLILMGVVCGCCVLLYVVVTYLCVVVRRIRRKLNHLSKARDGCTVMKNVNKLNTGEDTGNLTNSGNEPYEVKPLTLTHRSNSHCYSNPEETVTFLEINREVQQQISNIANKQVLESSTRQDSTRNSSSESNDAQPVYTNGEELTEQLIYENDNEPSDDSTYQNTGDLAYLNNPERIRCNTMDISQIP